MILCPTEDMTDCQTDRKDSRSINEVLSAPLLSCQIISQYKNTGKRTEDSGSNGIIIKRIQGSGKSESQPQARLKQNPEYAAPHSGKTVSAHITR